MWWIGWWPRAAGASSVGGCCRRGWWCTSCWPWRCSRPRRTWRSCGIWSRACAGWAGGAPGGCRRSRRCFAPGSGWGPSRCGYCLPPRPGRWPGRRHRGRSGGGCGCWRSTGPAGTLPTRRPTTRRSGVPAPTGARVAGHFRRSAWWRWWSAARTRWSMPSWTAAVLGRSRWPLGWCGRPGRGCWCWPTGSSRGRRCGGRLPQPALTCCGGCRPTGSLRSTVPCRTGRG
jgi:hypothetical protein